jgi:hypothetical protein
VGAGLGQPDRRLDRAAGRGAGLLGPGQQHGTVMPGLHHLAPQCGPLLAQPVLHGREPVGAEQLLQQRAPDLGICAQECRELALRQQDQLGELVRAHPEHLLQQVRGLVDPG